MKVIKSRVPFLVNINEPLQTGAKIELYIWNAGEVEPILPTKTLTKLIPSFTQTNLTWNISPFLESNFFCRVKKFALVSGVYNLVGNDVYVVVNGFKLQTEETYLLLLKNENIKNYYHSVDKIPFVNVLIDKGTLVTDFKTRVILDGGIVEAEACLINNTSPLQIKYERNDGVIYSVTVNILEGQEGVFNLEIPLTIEPIDGNFVNGSKLTLPDGTVLNTYKISECKYTPIECSFINSYGGWEFLTFFKAQTNTIDIKGSEYKGLNGLTKSFNINGTQTTKLNTGWVPENYNELIHDLLLSETVFLDDKPVIVKTQNHVYKTVLKDKMINFEIEFKDAGELINNSLL